MSDGSCDDAGQGRGAYGLRGVSGRRRRPPLPLPLLSLPLLPSRRRRCEGGPSGLGLRGTNDTPPPRADLGESRSATAAARSDAISRAFRASAASSRAAAAAVACQHASPSSSLQI